MSPDATLGTRDLLLACAHDLLAEVGVDGVTLRSIARRAGVSHGAPLKHFSHRAALFSAVAVSGFRELEARGGAARAACRPDATSREGLRAVADSYVDFALAEPGMFALMFRHDLLDGTDAELTKASLGAFETLVDGVRARQADGWRPDEDSRLLTGAFWCSLHGFAQLWIWGSLPIATRTTSRQTALDVTLRVLDLAPTDDTDQTRNDR